MPQDVFEPVNSQDDPTLSDEAKLHSAIFNAEYEHAIAILTRSKCADDNTRPAGSPDPTTDEVAVLYAELGARLRVVEELLLKEQSFPLAEVKPKVSRTTQPSGPELVENPIEKFGNVANLLNAEIARDGIRIRWTGAEKKTHFIVPANRSKASTLRLKVAAIIVPKYIKELKLFIDGTHQAYAVRGEGHFTVLECKVPAREDRNVIDLCIELPATHRPVDISESSDIRHLGIALASIGVVPRRRLLTRFLGK